MILKNPSSEPSAHLLPPGEKEERAAGTNLPSPVAGEGGARSVTGEGARRSTNKKLQSFSRTMRKNPTETERTLWKLLRNRRFADHKFRRQVPVGRYIVDFICYEAKLIVELDGSQHAENTKDVVRDNWLKGQGFEMLRIWNNELTNSKDSVLEAIWNAVQTGD